MKQILHKIRLLLSAISYVGHHREHIQTASGIAARALCARFWLAAVSCRPLTTPSTGPPSHPRHPPLARLRRASLSTGARAERHRHTQTFRRISSNPLSDSSFVYILFIIAHDAILTHRYILSSTDHRLFISSCLNLL